MIPKEVFISHAAKNRQTANAVAETLRDHGVPVWHSPTNIKSAQQWQDEIGKALRRCNWFLVLLTKASVSSKWVKMELMYALNHRQYNDHIVPVKVEKCKYEDLSWTLGSIQMINYDRGGSKAFREILSTWGLGFDLSKKANSARTRSYHKRRGR